MLCLFCKTILNFRFQIIGLRIFLKNGDWFDFDHALGNLPDLHTSK